MPLPTVTLPTHAELVDYLKTKDPNGEYVWQDPVFCLMGNFYRDRGLQGWGEVIYGPVTTNTMRADSNTRPEDMAQFRRIAEALKQLPPPAALIEHAKADRVSEPV